MEPMGERGRQGAAPLGGHTPGPWQPHGDIEDGVIAAPNGEVVVRPAHPIYEADRILIAAAPDMLEALELLRETHAHDGACRGRQCLAMHAAIAKARGEQ